MKDTPNTKQNLAFWDSRVKEHIASDFYDQEGFMNGKSSLREVELDFLGEVRGQRILHVQCHFGQDTLSMSRLGAQVTGVDFSAVAVETGRRLAQELSLDTQFVQADALDLPAKWHHQFDTVFASFGVIGWHEDLKKWASSVMKCVKPEGRFILIEFHPVVWMWNDNFTKVTYSYFNRVPIEETVNKSYASEGAQDAYDIVTWNHSLHDVFRAVKDEGMRLDRFEEYDYSPESCFEDLIEVDKGYQIKSLAGKIPMMYGMSWIKS